MSTAKISDDWLLGNDHDVPDPRWLEKDFQTRLHLARMRRSGADIAKALGVAETEVEVLLGGRMPTPEQDMALNRLLFECGLVPGSCTQPAPSSQPVCNVPAECNLPERLDAVENNLSALNIKLDTLLGLLGGALRSGMADDAKTKKAG